MTLENSSKRNPSLSLQRVVTWEMIVVLHFIIIMSYVYVGQNVKPQSPSPSSPSPTILPTHIHTHCVLYKWIIDLNIWTDRKVCNTTQHISNYLVRCALLTPLTGEYVYRYPAKRSKKIMCTIF